MHLNLTEAPTSMDSRAVVTEVCDKLSDLHDYLQRIGYFEVSEKDDYRLRLALADLARVGDNIDRVVLYGDDPR